MAPAISILPAGRSGVLGGLTDCKAKEASDYFRHIHSVSSVLSLILNRRDWREMQSWLGSGRPRVRVMSNPRVSSSKSGTVSGGPSGYTLPKKDETRSFRDFVLYAPAEGTKDWRHHLLKLVPASRSDQVDLRQFEQPVKLNRRDERYIRSLGQDAETNEEEDQRTASNPDRDESLIAPGASRTGNSESAAAKRRKPFEKKTTRVFQTDASMASRKLAREEQFPWLLEDATAKQRWVGHLAGGSSGLGGVHDGATGGTSATKAGAHVLFVVDEGQKGMHVLPADRTYRFHPKHTSRNVDADEAELEVGVLAFDQAFIYVYI